MRSCRTSTLDVIVLVEAAGYPAVAEAPAQSAHERVVEPGEDPLTAGLPPMAPVAPRPGPDSGRLLAEINPYGHGRGRHRAEEDAVRAAHPAGELVHGLAAGPGVIAGQQRGRAGVPGAPDLQPYLRAGRDVLHVAAPPAVLGHQPDDVAVPCDGDRRRPPQAGAAAGGLDQRENPRGEAGADHGAHAGVQEVGLDPALDRVAGHHEDHRGRIAGLVAIGWEAL